MRELCCIESWYRLKGQRSIKDANTNYVVGFLDRLNDLSGGFGIQIEEHISFISFGLIDDVCDIDIALRNDGRNF